MSLDTVLAPLDYMRVRVVGEPASPDQAYWVGRTGKVVSVCKDLPHRAHVQLDRQVRMRLFETKYLRVIGEHPSRALMLANGYTAADGPVSPTAASEG